MRRLIPDALWVLATLLTCWPGWVSAAPAGAVKDLEIACENGNADACNQAGLRYSNGQDVREDEFRATELYLRACDLGHAWGCYNAGCQYWAGDGAEADDPTALPLFEAACEQDIGDACDLAGLLLVQGEGVELDHARGVELYLRACDLDSATGCGNAALNFKEGTGVAQDLARALELYEKACDLEDGEACNYAGLAYSAGRGVEMDEAAATGLYLRACDLGEPWGCRNAGDNLSEGTGVVEDDLRAAELYLSACEQEVADACNQLGIHLALGLGVIENDRAANRYYLRACDLGEGWGCVNAAAQREGGNGTPPDPARALKLRERACAMEVVDACVEAAEQLEAAGTIGSAADCERFRSAACGMGDLDSCRWCWDRSSCATSQVESREEAIALALAQGERATAVSDWEGAIQAFRPAVERAALADPGHDEVLSRALLGLAWALTESGDHAEAIPLLEWTMLLQDRIDEVPKRQTEDAHYLLAIALMRERRELEAAEVFDALVERLAPAGDPEAVSYYWTGSNLGNENGAFVLARRLAERGLSALSGSDEQGSPTEAQLLTELARSLGELGDTPGARTHAAEAVAILDSWEIQRPVEQAAALDSLGSWELKLGDVVAARLTFGRALGLIEREADPPLDLLTSVLENLAQALQRPPDPDLAAARLLLLRSSNHQSSATEGHLDWRTVVRLGFWAERHGDPSDAAMLLLMSEAGDEETYGRGRRDRARARAHLGALLAEMGDDDGARSFTAYALAVAEAVIEDALSYSSEREALRLTSELREVLGAYLAVRADSADSTETYDAVLRWKGLVRRTMLRRGLDPRRSGPDRSELAETRDEIARISLNPLSLIDPAAQEALEEATSRKETLQREVAAAVALGAVAGEPERIDPGSLCEALAADTAVVDFVRYSPWTGAGDPASPEGALYSAFVTRGGDCESPVRVDLGPADVIDRAVELHRWTMGGQSWGGGVSRGHSGAMDHRGARPARPEGDDRAGVALAAVLWAPVEPFLDGRRRVLVVPDGPLHGVSLAALESRPGRYLVEDYVFAFLEDATVLAQTPTPDREVRGALVVGGLRFDAREGDRLAESSAEGSGGTSSALSEDSSTKTRASRCWGAGYRFLPATVTEADSVASRFQARYPREEVSLLTGDGVRAPELARHAESRRLVHLATHGFFGTDRCDRSPAQAHLESLNPMVLSGLVLSGANERLVDGSATEGYWTAEQIAGLDLKGTDLVVLSACETGLGEIRSGEGVMGLRRAFAQAGARDMVISLWPVPDRETGLLMDAFYDRILTKRIAMPPVDALREAQIEVLRQQRETTGEGNPAGWAGFVYTGRGDR
jgi:TPR repeat protein/CHAT domain-containing protein